MYAPPSTCGLIYSSDCVYLWIHEAFLLLRHMWVSAFVYATTWVENWNNTWRQTQYIMGVKSLSETIKMITFFFKSFSHKIEKVHVHYPIYNEIITICTRPSNSIFGSITYYRHFLFPCDQFYSINVIGFNDQ